MGAGDDSFLSGEVKLAMARVAVALEIERRAHGEFPVSLESVDAPTTDAWSGEPFGYRPDGNGGYVLWSVGEDGRDDGGDREKDMVWAAGPPGMPRP